MDLRIEGDTRRYEEWKSAKADSGYHVGTDGVPRRRRLIEPDAEKRALMAVQDAWYQSGFLAGREFERQERKRRRLEERMKRMTG